MNVRPRAIFSVFVLAELTSLTAYFIPTLNTVGFFAIVGAALALSLRRLEYGLYFVLADLILGGKSGALFSFEYGGFLLSLRMALFIVVMSVWVGKVVSECKIKNGKCKMFSGHPMLKWWGILGLAVVWGIVVGLVRDNDFGNLFLDANGYFYGALILPTWWHIKRSTTNDGYEIPQSFVVVFFAATTLLALKTLFSVYIFTHGLNNFIAANLIPFYRWVRDTGVGEITWLEGNFARVFFQSHIYNIMAWFVELALLVQNANSRECWSKWMRIFTLFVLNTAVIIVSLSRSFWIGVVVGLLILLIRPIGHVGRLRHIWRIARTVAIAGVAAMALLFAIARFPYQRPAETDLTQAVQSRFQFEAGAVSRWNLLPVMWSTVREHPIFGSGFGRTVTYISNDPRVRASSITGEYETYAFEWGWFDFWLKLGFVGILGLLGLILALVRALYKNHGLVGFAGLAYLFSLVAIHFFTPYLNHPLGFGLLIGLSLFAVSNEERG